MKTSLLKAFTLIELLIIIVIISILGITVVFIAYFDYNKKSRDTFIKLDFNKTQNALEMYKLNNNRYPTPCPTNSCSVGLPFGKAPLIDSDGTTYLNIIPKHTKNDITYTYLYDPITDTYTLTANLSDGTYYVLNSLGGENLALLIGSGSAELLSPTLTPVPPANTPLPPTATPTNTPTPTPISVKNVNILGQEIGNWGSYWGITVFNDTFKGIYATDLGVSTYFKGKIYFNIGDSGSTTSCSFLVAYGSNLSNLDSGVPLEGYTATSSTSACPGGFQAGKSLNSGGWTIPDGMFTLQQGGNEYMFAHYMDGYDFYDSDHFINFSAFAKYNEATRQFDPYKQNVYKWMGNWRHFGMGSFWPDYTSGYLYMIGSPPGRFGGINAARIHISSFLDSANTSDKWEYYLTDSTWSSNVDFTSEYGGSGTKGWRDVAWLIAPKYPSWSPSFNADVTLKSNWSQYCANMTIGEFSVVYNPYLGQFILLTGRPCDSAYNGGVYYYTAPNIWGPWSAEKLLISSKQRIGSTDRELDQYGTYTTDALLTNGGQTMYFVATTWVMYGVYWYKVQF